MTDVLGFRNNSGTAGVDGFQDVLARAVEELTADRDRMIGQVSDMSLASVSLSNLASGLNQASNLNLASDMSLASVGLSGLATSGLSGLSGLTETAEASGSGFDRLKDLASLALSRVNATQLNAEELAKDYALGENVEVHQVIMAAQEASLAFQLTVQIQNKLVEAYQEIMRMQV
jgi:flagellar hook-basal body complex protein FliE